MDKLLALKWATPSGFDRSVGLGAYAMWSIGRYSGPTQISEAGLFGSIIARDGAYGWAGKVQYMY